MLSSLFQPSDHSAVYHPVRVSHSTWGTALDALTLVETENTTCHILHAFQDDRIIWVEEG